MAATNRKPCPQHVTITAEKRVTHTYVDLFRTKNLRRMTFVICFLWMVSIVCFYGMTLNAVNMAGDIYLNTVLVWVGSYPALILVALLNFCKIGRKPLLLLGFTGAGVFLVICGFIPQSIPALSITLSLLGFVFIRQAFLVMYIYTTEVYPTVLRNIALGCASMSGRVAGILAPYLAMLGRYSPFLPILIMGAIALCGALVSLLLPETMGKPLVQTREEGELHARLVFPKCLTWERRRRNNKPL